MAIHYRKIVSPLLILIILISIPTLVTAKEVNSIDLIVTDTKFISDLTYWGRSISGYVKNYAGELEIKITNEGSKASPPSELIADLRYVYSKPGSSPVIFPTGYEEGRLQLGQIEIPSIPPKGNLTKKIKTNRILLQRPAVDDAITLSILIRDLSTRSMVLYDDLIDEVLTNKSDAISEERSGINFILTLITFIIVFITLVITLPEKRPIVSVVIIVSIIVIAYLIYKSV